MVSTETGFSLGYDPDDLVGTVALDLVHPEHRATVSELRSLVYAGDAQTGIEVGRDGRMYVFTDLDAPRGRLCVTDPQHLAPAHWNDLLPQDDAAVLDGFAILDGDPFSVYTKILETWVEGERRFDRADPEDRLVAEGGYGATQEQDPYFCCFGDDNQGDQD